MDETSHTSLETVHDVGNRLYLKRADFNFCVRRHGLGDVVELTSDIDCCPVDPSMVCLHAYEPGEIPFMK